MKNGLENVELTDTSQLHSIGFKGAKAGVWLKQYFNLPAKHNHWLAFEHGVVLRLGQAEYMLASTQALDMTTQGLDEVYQVPRFDASFTLMGGASLDLLSEICALDLAQAFDDQPSAVLLTQLAGISVILIRQQLHMHPLYKIWCDATYHQYMQETLISIGKDIAILDFKVI